VSWENKKEMVVPAIVNMVLFAGWVSDRAAVEKVRTPTKK
jgi:hypothetical protein